MQKIKMVIGANYGDEGKGLMTDYFCECAWKRNWKALGICSNGGAQRGHTVTFNDGTSHVFHHFSSGTYNYADTYLAPSFIINPMMFCQEYDEIISNKINERVLPYIDVYVNPQCRVTTPYDIILNQVLEDNRHIKHGSCGLGIFETFNRNKTRYKFNINDIFYNPENIAISLHQAKSYCLQRVEDLIYKKELNSTHKDYIINFINNKNIEDVYVYCLYEMFKHISLTTLDNLINKYYMGVIENGQGLLLDMDRDTVHKTPSHTGAKILLDVFNTPYTKEQLSDMNIELCYVTRSYMTRHGEGTFDTQCPLSALSLSEDADKNDTTNIPNDYQGTIRYGRIDIKNFKDTIDNDIKSLKDNFSKEKIKTEKLTKSLAITHLNETSSFIRTTKKDACSFINFCNQTNFINCYESYGKTSDNLIPNNF